MNECEHDTRVQRGGDATKTAHTHHAGTDIEFCRMGDLRRLFGLSRSAGYELAKMGRIKTVAVRQKGNARGIRLVSVPSVRAYLRGLMAGANGKAAA